MPRPLRPNQRSGLPRTRCAILSLSCAAATLILPSAAHGTVTVTESNQTFGEEFISHRLIFSRTLIGPVDYGLNGRYQSEIASGGTPTVSDMQFVTTYGAGPLPSGTFAVNTHLDPGLAGEGSVMITSLLAGYSISFNTDQPIQLALLGSSRLTRGDSTPGRPGQLRLETPQSTVFSWGSSNEAGELATLDTIIDLAPGAYRLVFNCGMTAAERFGNAPPSPTLLEFNMSFAIIPAPATLLSLATLPFLTAARRRRPSGR